MDIGAVVKGQSGKSAKGSCRDFESNFRCSDAADCDGHWSCGKRTVW